MCENREFFEKVGKLLGKVEIFEFPFFSERSGNFQKNLIFPQIIWKGRDNFVKSQDYFLRKVRKFSESSKFFKKVGKIFEKL